MKTYTTPVQIIKVNEILSKQLVKDVEGNLRYARGWTDSRVAEIVGCSTPAVVRLRSKLYGKVKKRHVDAGGGLEARIKRLEEICRRLCSEFNIEYRSLG